MKGLGTREGAGPSLEITGLSLRESLNPGGSGGDHQQQQPNVVSIVVDPPSSDEADGGGGRTGGQHGGNDSDPPIENDNPEGDEDMESRNVLLSGHDREKEIIESVKKRAQLHHRKRIKSAHSTDAAYVPPYKKNRFRHLPSVLPSKFLLGGNIRDPLNLASLSDARISAELNKATPQSSPLPVQGEVPVFIPKNPQDPLGLTTKTPENVQDIVAGVRKNSCSRKHRHRKRPGRKRTDSECSIGTEPANESHVIVEDASLSVNDDAEQLSKGQQLEQKVRRGDKEEADEAKVQKESKDVVVIAKSEPEESLPKIVNTKSSTSTATARNTALIVNSEILVSPAPPATAENVNTINANNASDSFNVESANTTLSSSDITTQSTTTSTNAATTSTSVVDRSHERHTVSGGGADEYEYEFQDFVPDDENRHYYGTNTTGPYNRSSSDYNNSRSSSTYAPSPFAFDSTEYFLEAPPYESPFSHFAYTPTHHLQPFSPPPLPELPPFQRRMQLFAARPQHLSLQRAVFHRPFRPFPNKKRGAKNKADPIVSPVIPQPGSQRRRGHHFHNNHNNKKPGDKANTSGGEASQQAQRGDTSTGSITTDSSANKKTFDRSKDKKIFQFGNYSNYYGYRTAEQGDPRLWALKKEYLQGKEVLDIGCNSGHVTLSIARDFEPRRIHGIDIDYSLIVAARKNIKHYMIRDPDNKDIVFPRSLPLIYGAMQPPPAPGEKTANVFPYNVSFAHENYVLTSDSHLDGVKPQYNVIICFSVTKWIHLNFGDDGLKRFFKRIFLHLHDEGILVLEPQPWSSYVKKKKLTEKVHQMFQKINFFPEQFEEYLLNEVGFATSECLGTPVHHSKGFQRPLLVFVKSKAAAGQSNLAIPTSLRNENTPCTETHDSISQECDQESPEGDCKSSTSKSPLQSHPSEKGIAETKVESMVVSISSGN